MIDPVRLERRIAELHALLVAHRRSDGLYSSNLDSDEKPSITVSSDVLQTFSELRDRRADTLYRAIIDTSEETSESGLRVWPSQGGGPPHVVASSWAITSCSRHRLDSLYELRHHVAWLLRQQRPDGSWGQTSASLPRPYYTALATNAILAYRDNATFEGSQFLTKNLLPELDDALERAISLLIGPGLSTADGELWLWDQTLGGNRVCLASTSLSLHIFLKLAKTPGYRHLRGPAHATLRRLAASLPPNALRSTALEIQGTGLRCELWPQIAENEPSYWYSFFTPLMALTFLDALEESPDSASYKAAIEECVRWILFDYEPHGIHSNAKGVWAASHALLIMHRVRSFAYYRATAVERNILSQLLTDISGIAIDPDALRALITSVDRDLLTHIPSPATPETVAEVLVSQLFGELPTLLKFLSVLAERHPGLASVERVRASLLY